MLRLLWLGVSAGPTFTWADASIHTIHRVFFGSRQGIVIALLHRSRCPLYDSHYYHRQIVTSPTSLMPPFSLP